MEVNKIEEIVLSFMGMIDAKTYCDNDGIWHASIPTAHRPFFNDFEEYIFTFDHKIAEKHREAELLCEGAYVLRKILEHVSSIPKVSRIYLTSEPELPKAEPGQVAGLRLLTPGEVRYRQKILFHFKVSFLCDQRQDSLFSVLADPAFNEVYLEKGFGGIAYGSFSETPDEKIPLEEREDDILHFYLRACRKLETVISEKLENLRKEVEERLSKEVERVNAYFDEQRRELIQKKENVYFHLYFFQKEEEIDRLIRDVEIERANKIESLRERCGVKVSVTLVNAIVICVPTHGIAAGTVGKKKRGEQSTWLMKSREEATCPEGVPLLRSTGGLDVL